MKKFVTTIASGKNQATLFYGEGRAKFEALPACEFSAGRIIFPASFAGTQLRIKDSESCGGTFVPAYDMVGQALGMIATASSSASLPPDFFSMEAVQLYFTDDDGNVANQSADVQLVILLK